MEFSLKESDYCIIMLDISKECWRLSIYRSIKFDTVTGETSRFSSVEYMFTGNIVTVLIQFTALIISFSN